jgi:predicted ATPase
MLPLVAPPPPPLVDGGVVLDFATRTARRDQTTLHLTGKEWALLAYLAATPGRTVSRQELLDAVWGYSSNVVTRTVDNTVRRLRSKIERNASEPRLLVTIYGDGYRLEPGTPPPPPPSPNLVGRDDLVESLVESLADPGWTTLLGPPGIGKTTLARAVSQRWSAASRWCPVGTVVTAPALEVAVSAALSSPTALRGLHRLEGGLLVLDNLEQLDDEARAVLASWVDAFPRVRFFGTSRARVGVPGERCVDLGPLPAEAAVALFLTRARERRADYAANTAPEVLRAVVDAVDRIPLAIELAAARARLLDPEVLLERLGDLASLGDAAARMRDAVAWSFALLDPADAAAAARLSVFRTGFTTEAAAAVTEVDDAVGLVEALVEHSLARPVDGGRQVRMYEIVRQHAARRLAEDPAEARAAKDGHLAFWVEQVSAWRSRGDGRTAAQTRLADLRSASDHARGTGRADDALQVARMLATVLGVSADWAYALDRLHEAAVDPRVTDDVSRFRALSEAASLAAHRRGVDAGAETAGRAFGLAVALGDPELLGIGAHGLGVMELRRGRWALAVERFREAGRHLDTCPESAVVRQRAVVCSDLSQALARGGDPEAARAVLQQGLALRRRAGDRPGEGTDLLSLGLVHQALDELVDAEQVTRAALLVLGELGDEVHQAKALANLGAIALVGGRPREAAALSRQAADRFAALDHRPSLASALGNLTHALGNLGRVDEGLRAGEEGVAHALAVGAAHLAACNRVYLAEVLHEAGRRDDALRVLTEAIRAFERVGDTALHGWALRVRAFVRAGSAPVEALLVDLDAARAGRDAWITDAAVAVVQRSPCPTPLPPTPRGTAWGHLVALAAGDRGAAAALERPDPAREGLSVLATVGDLRRWKVDLGVT